MKENTNTLQWVMGGALIIIIVLLAMALTRGKSQTDSATTSATVTNVAPTVDSVYINETADSNANTYTTSNAITLTPNSTKTVHVNGVITDLNGVGTGTTSAILSSGNLQGVEAMLYRTGSGVACAENAQNCVDPASSCTLTALTATTVGYNCVFNLQYYADSTSTGGQFPDDTWTAGVLVIDDACSGGFDAFDQGNCSTSSGSNTKLLEIGTLLSLGLPSSISYGTLALGVTTSNSTNTAVTITQTGNDVGNVQVSGADMTCTQGTIPLANQNWALTDVGGTDGSVTVLTGSAVTAAVAVPYRTSASQTTSTLYWNLTMPTSGVGGTCTGTNTITAIAS